MPVKNLSHNVWIIFRTVVYIALFPTVLWARVELRSISTSGGTVVFSFSELPQTAIPELSADKTRIILHIPDAFASEKAREGIKPTESIELISMQQKGSELTVYVVLRKKAGCTQALLPYSRTLRLHIVDWEKLTARDNLYHSGLLSLDSGVPATARTGFKRAANAGSGDAAAMLGIMLAAEGNVAEAERELRRATDLGTSIPDVYAALADIAAYRDDTTHVRQYADQFRRKAGVESFPSLLGHLPKEITTSIEPATFAQTLLVDEQPDTNTSAATKSADTARTDSSLNDEVSQKARALVSDTTSSRSLYNGESLVPSWMKWTVFGFLFFVAAGVVGIVYLYMRWRKKQLQKPISVSAPDKASFESEVNNALQSTSARRATDVYNRSSGEEPTQPEPDREPAPPELQPQNEVAQRHWMDDINEETVETLDAAQHAPESLQPPDDVDALAQKLRRGRGELELAVKLLARKKQDNKDKAGSINPEEIPGKPAQLSRLAGTLGVGSGELEIRRNLGSAEEGDRAEKMRSLFGSGPKANN